MEAIDGLLYGLSVAFTWNNLLAALVGALAGTLIGVLPGLGPTAGIAMILPLSYSLDPTSGLIMMAGMYYGAMYGGSTTAVLINMPGESASVITCIDGYKLTKKRTRRRGTHDRRDWLFCGRRLICFRCDALCPGTRQCWSAFWSS